MKKISDKLPDLFYHSGERKTVPSCPVSLVPDFNPSAGVPSYIEGDEDCTETGTYFIPFFNDKSGPKHEDTTTNGHEARPGHHLQVRANWDSIEGQIVYLFICLLIYF